MTRKEQQLQVAEKREVQPSNGEATFEGRMYIPQVDIFEDDDSLTLVADMPGVKRDEIDIDLREGILTLNGRVAEPHTPEGWQPLHSEHDVGGFARRFTLGERIAQEKISATLENGVLRVVLPKAEAHKPRRIEVR